MPSKLYVFILKSVLDTSWLSRVSSSLAYERRDIKRVISKDKRKNTKTKLAFLLPNLDISLCWTKKEYKLFGF
jgi:hypothetical protein